MRHLYPDASVLVSLVSYDVSSERAEAIWPTDPDTILIGDFTVAECSSAIARRYRIGELSDAAAKELFDKLDSLTRALRRIETAPSDIRAADELVRRLDLALRAPDALHVATARRLGSSLATFDRQMAVAARALGLTVID